MGGRPSVTRMVRSPISLLAALAVLSAVPSLPPSPAEGADRPKLSRCDIGVNRTLLCGRVMVPAVRGEPSLGRQKIAFAIRPRGDRSRPSKGAILFLEGGPGFAATNADSFRSLAAVMAPFLRRHALIAIDQRGTGLSTPLLCRALQRGTVGYHRGLRRCARQLGPRRRGFTTAESAADVEAVRRALGLPKRKMIVYGDSYGTYLGQAHAARYGRGVKGLVLSSAYPGNDPYWRTLYPAAERAIRRSCARSPGCAGDALARLHRAFRKAGVRSRLTSNLLSFLMGDAANYAPGAFENLNRVVSLFLRGRPAALRRLVAPGGRNQGPAGYFSFGMYAAVVCNDYPTLWDKGAPVERRRHQLIRSITAFRPAKHWAPIPRRTWAFDEASGMDFCLPWPRPTPDMEPPIPPGRKMPAGLRTLVLAGEFDTITSVREARQVKRRFPRGRLYVVPNRGHASELYFPFASPATDRIRHFIRGLDH